MEIPKLSPQLFPPSVSIHCKPNHSQTMNSDFDAIFKVTRTCDDEIAGFAATPLTDVEKNRIRALADGERELATLDGLAPMLRDNSTALEYLADLLKGSHPTHS